MSSSGRGRLLRTQMIRRLRYGGTPTALSDGLNPAAAPLADYFWGFDPELIPPVAPERLERPGTQQPDSFTFAFSPDEKPVEVPTFFGVVAPERLVHEAPQQPDAFVFAFSPSEKPVEIPDFFGAFAPQHLDRLRPEQPDTEAIFPEEKVVTVPFFAVVMPDQFGQIVPQQPPPLVAPLPEQKLPGFYVSAPERLERPAPRQPESFVALLRERTATFFDTVGPPDRAALRPQQPDSEVLPLRERATFFDVVAPARIDRPRPEQPDSAVELLRERTVPLATVVAPEHLPRWASQQPDSEVFPLRERSVFFDAVAPARIDRPRPEQPESSVELLRDRTSPLATVVAPERLAWPIAQQPDAEVFPLRERAVFFDAVAPARLDRLRPEQPESVVELLLDRTAPLAVSVEPEPLVWPAPQQPEAEVLALRPLAEAPTFFEAIAPEHLDRLSYAADRQLAFVIPWRPPAPPPPPPPPPPGPDPIPTPGGYPAGSGGGSGGGIWVPRERRREDFYEESDDDPNDNLFDEQLGAIEAEARASLRRAAKKWHPDVGGDPETFADLTAAYDAIHKLSKAKRQGGISIQESTVDPEWQDFLDRQEGGSLTSKDTARRMRARDKSVSAPDDQQREQTSVAKKPVDEKTREPVAHKKPVLIPIPTPIVYAPPVARRPGTLSPGMFALTIAVCFAAGFGAAAFVDMAILKRNRKDDDEE